MKAWIAAVAVAGCQNALDQRLAIVNDTRVLAIVSEPAEAKPGATVAYSALVGSPHGPDGDAPAWSLCTAPKPPTDDDAVSTACFGSGSSLVAIDPTAAMVPTDACMQFGPDVQGSGFRPRDPDPTGGYYQPVRADVPGTDLAFGFTRITCDLANAPFEVAEAYLKNYVANANPTLVVDAPANVAADSDVTLTASWPAASAETYLYYDQVSETLVTRRESMRVSWYATGGSLPVDATAVDEDDPTTSVSTTWHTPAAGAAWLWFVLRDSRGGIATASVAVTVQ
ncbi:MAG TPA: hypothetical protein VMJ10_35020 [Kofleriaceae bacterium]|nr:hypothetical protein [Kofleriaceae bacterium]